MLRLRNKLVTVDDSRLVKKIFNWDKQLKPDWSKHVYHVFVSLNCDDFFFGNHIIDLHFVHTALRKLCRNNWKNT